MVITTAGPMRPRMVQRAQWQRTRSLTASAFPWRSQTAAAQPVAEHQHAHDDQQHRPELLDTPPGKPVEVVQQEQNAHADDQHRTNRAPFAELFQRILKSMTGEPGFRGAIRIDRHVDPQTGEANPKRRFRAAAQRAVHADNEAEEENREMDDAFAVLLVVKSAEARQKSKEECEDRARPHPRRDRSWNCNGWPNVSRIAWSGSDRWRRGNAYNLRQAVFAVEHVSHRPHAQRAHRLPAMAAITCGVHLGMDRTLHGILLAPASPPIIHGAATNGISSASTSTPRITSFARFCCFGPESVPSVLPGCLSGEDLGTVLSFDVGISLSCRRRD